MSTMIRRSRNQISTIKNSVGEWLYDERDVMEHIRRGFEGLFCSSLALSERNPPLLTQGQAYLSKDDCESLCVKVTEEEIKFAL